MCTVWSVCVHLLFGQSKYHLICGWITLALALAHKHTHTHVRREDAQRAVRSHVVEERAKFNTNVLIAFAESFSPCVFFCLVRLSFVLEADEIKHWIVRVLLILSIWSLNAFDKIIMCIAFIVQVTCDRHRSMINLITCNLTQLHHDISVEYPVVQQIEEHR